MEKPFEIVPDNVSDKDVKNEAHRRAARCGYCTREGNPPYRQKISAGWSKQYEENYVRIFGHD